MIALPTFYEIIRFWTSRPLRREGHLRPGGAGLNREEGKIAMSAIKRLVPPTTPRVRRHPPWLAAALAAGLAMLCACDPGPVDLLDGVEPNEDVVGDTIGILVTMELGAEHIYNSLLIDGEEVDFWDHPVSIIEDGITYTYHVFFTEVPPLVPPVYPRMYKPELQAIVRNAPGGQPLCCDPVVDLFTILPNDKQQVLLNISNASERTLSRSDIVDVHGWGFDGQFPGQNLVSVNIPSIPATVADATENYLEVVLEEVPTCGVVDMSVNVDGQEASHVFAMGIWLQGSYPDMGEPGDRIVLRGSRFDPNPARNKVRFRTLEAAPTNITADPFSGSGSGSSSLFSANTMNQMLVREYHALSQDPLGFELSPGHEPSSVLVDTAPESVDFQGRFMELTIPNEVAYGTSSITVVIDGIASNPVPFFVIATEPGNQTVVDVHADQLTHFSEDAHDVRPHVGP